MILRSKSCPRGWSGRTCLAEISCTDRVGLVGWFMHGVLVSRKGRNATSLVRFGARFVINGRLGGLFE